MDPMVLLCVGALISLALPISIAIIQDLADHHAALKKMCRQLESFPLTPINQAIGGRVVIQGRARARKSLIAPISGKQVIAYRILWERFDGSGWEKVFDLSDATDFVVEDASGRVLVNAKGKFRLLLKKQPCQKFPASPSTALKLFLAKRGIQDCENEPLRDGEEIHLSEFLLEPDHDVVVFGQARRITDARGEVTNYRAPPTRIEISKPSDGPLFIGDRPLADLLREIRYEMTLPQQTLSDKERQESFQQLFEQRWHRGVRRFKEYLRDQPDKDPQVVDDDGHHLVDRDRKVIRIRSGIPAPSLK
jgi:hypothetical protein